jgi:hypothetical protein
MSIGGQVRLEALVAPLVEPECDSRAAHEDRTANQIRVVHHEIDRFFLRLRERAFLEDGAACTHEVEKAMLIDVLLEELPRGRCLVDVDLLDVNLLLVQDTPGVLARGSGGLRVEKGSRHPSIVK